MTEVYGNRYEALERVGDGGMATVYRGTDRVLKRDVAIKVMHPHLANKPDARARFNREAESIARLHHGNIVDVYDFSGGADDEAYLITEVVHGEVERDGQDCPAWCGVGGTGGPAPDYRPSTSENPSACRA